MIKRNNKKGFTIVELVIVIAVIAILAAVLIPTFAGIIRKANISADTQLAKNLNTTLVSEEAVNGAHESFNEVLSTFRDNGFVIANLNPTTNGCYFVWESTSNQILLVDAEDNFKVLYAAADDYAAIGNTWYFAVSDKETADALKAKNSDINVAMTIAAGNDLNAALGAITGTETIYVDESLVIDKNSVVVLDNADAKITIDLGTSTVSGNNGGVPSYDNIPFSVKAGELTLTGGIISSTGDALDSDGEIMNNVVMVDGATLNVKDSKIDAPSSTIALAFSNGAKATLENVEIVANDNVVQPSNGSEVLLKNCKIECAYLGVFSSSSGGGASVVTIDGGTYHATTSNLLGVHGGSIVVKDGTFNCDAKDKTFKLYNVSGGKIVIEGGTFNDVAFANLDAATIKGFCNFSECPESNVTIAQENGAWVITVK